MPCIYIRILDLPPQLKRAAGNASMMSPGHFWYRSVAASDHAAIKPCDRWDSDTFNMGTESFTGKRGGDGGGEVEFLHWNCKDFSHGACAPFSGRPEDAKRCPPCAADACKVGKDMIGGDEFSAALHCHVLPQLQKSGT